MSIGTARPFAPARDSCRRGSAAPPAAQPHCAADAGQHGQQARADQEDTPSVPGEEEDQEEEEEEEEDEVYVADADVADFVPLASDSEPMTDDDDADGDEVRGEAAAAEAGEAMEDGGAAEENVVDTSVQGFFAHKEPVYAMHIHPLDEHLVASGGGDDKMYLWRSDTGDTVRVFGGHADSVVSVKFSANGEFVASGGMDGKVLVYRSATGELAVELEGPDEVVWIDWHPKGNILLAGSSDGTIWMWLVPSATCPKVFSGHSGPVSAGRFTPDGKKIVSVSEDSSFVLWDPKTASALLRLSGEDARFHTGSITCVAVNRESTLAITGSEDGTARLINLQSGVILAALDNHSASIESVGFCDTIPLVATAGVDGQVSIWDVQTFALRIVLTGHADAVTQLAWHRLSPVLTTCSADGTVLTWDARSGECVSKQGGHFGAVLSLGVTADGRRAISGGDDGVCLVFDLLQ